MQYNKLSSMVQEHALRLDELEYAPALCFFAAGEEHYFFTVGGAVSVAYFAAGAGTLMLDGAQVAQTEGNGVYKVRLAAGKHGVKLTASGGSLAVLGGKEI